MNEDILIVRDPCFLEHSCSDPHPECPQRLALLLDAINREPELSALPVLGPVLGNQEQLQRVHGEPLLAALSKIEGEQGWIDPDTYYGPKSYEVALKAVGSTIEAARSVWEKKSRRAFCLVRPPGHHATPSKAMGFCLFNTVAVTVAALLAEKPGIRIAVVDYDLHHGNGTQEAFYSNPNVLFLSSHRFPYYPGSGSLDERGIKKGEGLTVNFPLAQPFGDPLFYELYSRCVLPILESFGPDMILVSTGYDGHEKDPMQGFKISTETFGYFNEALIALAEKHCHGRIVFCLEGGYSPEAVRDCGLLTLRQLKDLPREPFEVKPPSFESGSVVDKFVRTHRSAFPGLS